MMMLFKILIKQQIGAIDRVDLTVKKEVERRAVDEIGLRILPQQTESLFLLCLLKGARNKPRRFPKPF